MTNNPAMRKQGTRALLIVGTLLLATLAFIPSVNATWTEAQKIIASDAVSGQTFGGADLDIDGDTIAVASATKVYIYTREDGIWDETQIITGLGSACAIALQATTLVIGGCGVANGVAWIYTNVGGTWELDEQITASDGASLDAFGASVAIDGDIIAVGAPGDDDGASNAGAVYIYIRNGNDWEQQDKLLAETPALNSADGTDVSISGLTVAVGAQNVAKSYTRVANVWTEDDLQDFTGTATRVAISGNLLFVGAYTYATERGAVYAYKRIAGSWSFDEIILAFDGDPSTRFGWSMDYSGSTLAVGSPQVNDGAALYVGAAYMFRETAGTWEQLQVLAPGDTVGGGPFPSAQFGYTLAIDADTIVGGAPNEDNGGAVADNPGAAYVFNVDTVIEITNPEDGDVFTISPGGQGFRTVLLSADASDESGIDFVRFYRGDTTGTLLCEDDAAPYACNVDFDPGIIIITAEATGNDADTATDTVTFTVESVVFTDGDSFEGDFAGSQLGSCANTHGDYTVVGAAFEEEHGAAYIYHHTGGWEFQEKVIASDPDDFSLFGISCGINAAGDTVVVGAPAQGPADAGAVYVYTRTGSTWVQQQKLVAADAETEDNYGVSVAISGETVVVGATLEDGAGSDRGKAYVYTRSGTVWTQQQQLTANDAANSDVFGTAVAIQGDQIVVGAGGEDGAGTNRGAAYYYTRAGTTWTQQQKIDAFPPSNFASFGRSVSIFGDVLVVGAPAESSGIGCPGNPPTCFEFSGAAYTYTLVGSAWADDEKLTAGDRHDGGNFGASVAIDDATMFIGANDLGTGADIGSAYVFVNNAGDWEQLQRLIPSDGGALDAYGTSVGLSGLFGGVGAPRHDGSQGVDSGKFYFYDKSVSTGGISVGFSNPSEAEVFIIPPGETAYDVDIQVFASSGAGIMTVEIFLGAGTGGTMICSDDTFPYQCTEPFTAGNYTITARATDNAAQTGLATVTFRVTGSGFPFIEITAPSEGATAVDPVFVTADASDSGGRIVAVTFYDGTTLTPEHVLCYDQVAPYGCSVNYFSNGPKIVTAVAIDNENLEAQDAVSFTVTGSSGSGGPPGGSNNFLSQLIQYLNNAWGFDWAWIVGAMFMFLAMWAASRTGSIILQCVTGIVMAVANIKIGLWPEWGFLILVLLLAAIVGNRFFGRGEEEGAA